MSQPTTTVDPRAHGAGRPNPLELGDKSPANDARWRREVRQGWADGMRDVRAKSSRPPHSLLGGFFTAPPRPTPRFTDESVEGRQHHTPWAPIGPLRQSAELFGAGTPLASRAGRVGPDRGRRVQLFWEELLPDSPPLRVDETVRFIRLVEWLGRVDSIRGERFAATLWDRNCPGAVEEVELFLTQLSDYDRNRLRDGAFFYWVLGYTENAVGHRSERSWIWLRPPRMRG